MAGEGFKWWGEGNKWRKWWRKCTRAGSQRDLDYICRRKSMNTSVCSRVQSAECECKVQSGECRALEAKFCVLTADCDGVAADRTGEVPQTPSDAGVGAGALAAV